MGYCSTDKNGMLHAKIHGSSSSGSGLNAQGDRTVDPLFLLGGDYYITGSMTWNTLMISLIMLLLISKIMCNYLNGNWMFGHVSR